MKSYPYPFFVEYIDNGVLCSDHWSERCLTEELKRGEVQIVHIALAWSVQEALGLVKD